MGIRFVFGASAARTRLLGEIDRLGAERILLIGTGYASHSGLNAAASSA
ncbi:hypothetical protein [Nocardia arthritidis]|nr:hypothetical protein [Nocardia arthritidis]